MPTLHWVGKDKVIHHHRDVPYRVLKKQYHYQPASQPASQLYASDSDQSPNNRIIHGDNLEALKSLLPEFEGKINCIYIDPPYNTGNEGWVYNDNVNDPKIKKWLGQVVGKEGEDLSRHDKWLCMMYPRLKLLHRLLANNGVIFISIDDNEQANLKLLCDEIFGLRNFIGPIIQNKMNAKNDSLNIQKNHEFILIYGKAENIESTLLLSDKSYVEKRVFEENGDYYFINDPITTRGEGGTLNARPNLGYTVYYNPKTNDKIGVCDYDDSLAKESNDEAKIYSIDTNLIAKGYFAIRPPKVRNKLGAWTWDLAKFNKDKRNIIVTGKKGAYSVKKRTFVNKDDIFTENRNLLYRYYNPTNSRSILDFSTNDGTKVLNDIMNESNTFDNPKNLELIEYLLGLTQNKNSIILDSFAGSGTTAHATLKLNQDGGNRRFILIETMDYAETITAERVRRVMNGYGEGKQAVAGLGGSFDYYTVGERLLLDDGMLNPSVGLTAIRDYVAWTEGIPIGQCAPITPVVTEGNASSQFWLGEVHGLGLFFVWDDTKTTTLDLSLLNKLVKRSGRYLIYADQCALGEDFMRRHEITYKKIPRDITRL